MKMRIDQTSFLALVLLAFAAGNPASSYAESFSLSGSDWFIHEDASGAGVSAKWYQADVKGAGWISARVPGNIQADLEAAHRLNPLWYGAGDPRLAEVAEKDWWYRKDFVLPKEFRNQRARLIFDGVDFECEVWLNGKRLGTHAGQFRRFGFDVANVLRPGEKNQLAVRIGRAPAEVVHCLAASDGALSGLGTPDWFVNCYNYTRQVLKDLKSVTNFGYDWGVNIYTLGIWKDVTLEATGPACIEWVQVQTELAEGHQKATVKARLELDSLALLKARAMFRIRGHGADTAATTEAPLQKGSNFAEAQLVLDKPALWWPNGQGEQPLYELEARLEDTSSGEELDRKTTRFGVREVRWEQVEGAPPDFINPYRLVVNGRPVRMMGSDMIWPDLLCGRSGERGSRLLHLAKVAGMNTVRLNGAGAILSEEFCDSADELGIMLSQEFPLANAWPETDPVFLSNLEATARNIVKQLRNHPSIIEWAGGNEMPWQQGTDHPALHVLERVCAENDTRIFRATDPMQGSKHSPWLYHPATHYDHYNKILESFLIPNPDLSVNTMNAMRYGEFGTQTPANLELFQREIPPSSQWPLSDIYDPVLIRKNVLQAAFTPLDWLVKPLIEGFFGPFEGPERLLAAGQFIGAEGLRYALDELRRKGKRIGGLTSWDFGEPFPNGAGSYMVDYDGRPLMNYDFVRQALAPMSLTLRYSSIFYDPSVGIDAGLWLVSDAPGAASDLKWSWTARDRRGQVIAQNNGTAAIQPQESRELGRVKVKPFQATALGPIFIELRLTDTGGELLAERLHVFGADNVFIWPFDGLLRNTDPDEDDTSLMVAKPRVVRVLWIQDWNDGRYEDLAWYLRRHGIQSTHVPATPEALGKAAPDAETLTRNYDVIWLGEGDYRKAENLAKRLGPKNLSMLSQAVQAGFGLGVEGGWGGYADAGFEGTPLAEVLPVTFVGRGNEQRRGPGAIGISDPTNPLVVGQLGTSFPARVNYNLVKAKQEAKVIVMASEGDGVLITGAHGKGRVLAYASGLTGSWSWQMGKVSDWGWSLRAWSGGPFFVARMLTWLSGAPDSVVSAIDLPTPTTRLTRPVRRTTLQASPRAGRIEAANEILAIELKNSGDMTALFCEPHPLLEYRTDITILNNHAFVPPGESRTVTILAPKSPRGGLTLAQTGWRISCWNANDVLIGPSEDVLLSVGRRDSMTREYLGYGGSPVAVLRKGEAPVLDIKGNRPDPSLLPLLLPGPKTTQLASAQPHSIRFVFDIGPQRAAQASRLRIHTADQDSSHGPVIGVNANGQRFEKALGPGLGKQLSDPAHLAFPATAQFDLPPGTWKPGKNSLEIWVTAGGWFSWDSLELVTVPQQPNAVEGKSM